MATVPSNQHSGHDDELAPDEPRTPLWLTGLGVGLFLLAGIYFVVSKPDPAPRGAAAAEGADAGAAEAPAAPEGEPAH